MVHVAFCEEIKKDEMLIMPQSWDKERLNGSRKGTGSIPSRTSLDSLRDQVCFLSQDASSF